MKCWWRIAIGMWIPFVPFLLAGVAFAQNGEEEPPIMSVLLLPAQLVVKSSILLNELLCFWVTANYDFSDPLGERLLSVLAVFFPLLTDFFAQLLGIFF